MLHRRLIVRFAVDLLFDDDDSGDDSPTIITNKIWNYAEEIVPTYSDRQFQKHFRLKPATFENVLAKLYSVSNENVTGGNPEVPLEKQLMISLWYLANLESFR
jgi:hypothetical protein